MIGAEYPGQVYPAGAPDQGGAGVEVLLTGAGGVGALGAWNSPTTVETAFVPFVTLHQSASVTLTGVHGLGQIGAFGVKTVRNPTDEELIAIFAALAEAA